MSPNQRPSLRFRRRSSKHSNTAIEFSSPLLLATASRLAASCGSTSRACSARREHGKGASREAEQQAAGNDGEVGDG